MSVSQQSDGGLPEVWTYRLVGYGAAAVGTAALLMRVIQPGPVWTAVLLLAAFASLTAVVRAPEAFEMNYRRRFGGETRGVNILVGAPAAFLFFIGLTDQVDDITLPVAGAAVGAAAMLMVSMRALDRSSLASPLTYQVMMAVLGAAAGYGALVALDVDYDGSAPAILPVPVLDKYVTHGRSSTTYHLRVPPFADRRAASSLTVNAATYRALNAGDMVCVLEHRGAIGLPWVTARLCDR
jgi:hypothetical protein